MQIPYQSGDNRPALYVCRVLGGSLGAYSPNHMGSYGCVEGKLCVRVPKEVVGWGVPSLGLPTPGG